MKIAFRFFGLSLVVAASLSSPAKALGNWVGCYYMCPEGRHITQASLDDCCFGGTTGNFPCADGSQGSPYMYKDAQGLKLCQTANQ